MKKKKKKNNNTNERQWVTNSLLNLLSDYVFDAARLFLPALFSILTFLTGASISLLACLLHAENSEYIYIYNAMTFPFVFFYSICNA